MTDIKQPKFEVVDGDADKLTEEEKGHPVTRLELRKFVREEMVQQNKDIQKAFDEQAHYWMLHQSQYNKVFNAINVIVRVLYKKGLITNDMLEEAGYELALEARQNLEQMKLMQKQEVTYDKTKIKPSALDEAIAHAVTPSQGKAIRELRTIVEVNARRGRRE